LAPDIFDDGFARIIDLDSIFGTTDHDNASSRARSFYDVNRKSLPLQRIRGKLLPCWGLNLPCRQLLLGLHTNLLKYCFTSQESTIRGLRIPPGTCIRTLLKDGKTLKIIGKIVAGDEAEPATVKSTIYCIKAGGTGGADTDNKGWVKSQSYNLLERGEVLGIQNATVMLLDVE